MAIDKELDRRMDRRLRGAGSRWQARYDAPALVDLRSVRGGGRDRAGARSGHWRWIAPVAAAVLVALIVGITQLGESPTGSPVAAPGGSTASGDAGSPPSAGASTGPDADESAHAGMTSYLFGHDWNLAAITDADGDPVPVVADATFEITGDPGDAMMSFGEGCATALGPAAVDAATIELGPIGVPEIACPDRPDGFDELVRALILASSDPLRWAITGDTLTLTAADGAVFTFTVAPATTESDPDAVFAGTWTLVTIQGAVIGASPDSAVTARPAPDGATVTWHADGTLTVSACNDYLGSYRDTDTSVTVEDLHTVGDVKPCPSSANWHTVLAGTTDWTAADGRLTLTAADGRALFFRATDR